MSGPRASDVLFVAGQLGRGGAEQQLYYMAVALQEAGVMPAIVSMTTGEHWEQPLLARDIPVHCAGASTSHARRLIAVTGIARRTRPSIIQSAHFQTNLYAVFAARAAGALDIGAIRNSTRSSVRDLGVLGMPSLRAPKLIAVNSQRAIEEAIELGISAEKLHLLTNVVDLDRFAPGSAAVGERRIELLAVGRLVLQKRLDRFVRLVAHLAHSRSAAGRSLRATVVGAGPLDRDLRDLALQLGVSDHFRWVGEADAAPWYRDADLLVVTSEFEGTPNVVLEAMASGLPVVAFGVGDVPVLIEHEVTGLLIAPGDEAGLAIEVERLVRSDELRRRLGSAARQHVERHHARSLLTERLDELHTRRRAHRVSSEGRR